ncbi:MAG: AAA family ATPase [Caldilinea sp.]|nr:AAA family ATPase [Caldilinea sp.]
MASLTVRLLGPPSISRDGAELAFATRKAVALFALLAISGTRHRREELAALFWPESGEHAARNALRYTLSTLRQTVGPEVLDVERDSIAAVQTDDLWVDAVEFRRLTDACRSHKCAEHQACQHCKETLTAATRLYAGEFMASFTLADSPAFDEWQRAERQSLCDDLASALERLVDYAIAEADWPAAIAHAQRRLGLDPLHEPAHQQLMRVYAWAGRRTAALRQYAECARVLSESLSIAPAPETAALYAAIRERAFPETVSEQRPVSVTRPDVAAECAPDAADGAHLFVRAKELACLEDALARACAGDGQVVFVAGEAGSGKSALLHEFARRALATYDTLAIATGSGTAQTGAGRSLPALVRDLRGLAWRRSAARMCTQPGGRRESPALARAARRRPRPDRFARAAVPGNGTACIPARVRRDDARRHSTRSAPQSGSLRRRP